MKSTRLARVLVGLLAILGLLTTACGNDDTGDSPPATAEVTAYPTAEITPTATAPITASPTAEPTPAATSQPTESATPEPTPAEEPTPTLAPTPAPTPELTLEPMDGASPTPDAGTTIELEVVGGKPVDGVQRYRIDARDVVTIIVTGDTTDELHIHGYDLVVPFAPGQPGSITFEANIPGIFEVETHHHGDLVMELQVG
ncbi:MAG: hypothetical protein OXF99_07435 [bacterium]|nr:hypothetical protein [bacterium]